MDSPYLATSSQCRPHRSPKARSQELVDDLFKRFFGLVGEILVDLVGRWGQSGQVECDAPNERQPIGFANRRQSCFFLLRGGIDQRRPKARRNLEHREVELNGAAARPNGLSSAVGIVRWS